MEVYTIYYQADVDRFENWKPALWNSGLTPDAALPVTGENGEECMLLIFKYRSVRDAAYTTLDVGVTPMLKSTFKV